MIRFKGIDRLFHCQCGGLSEIVGDRKISSFNRIL